MSGTPKDSTEAEDVLEFLNSLPESSKNSTGNDSNSAKGQNDQDILGFLDELEAGNESSKTSTAVPTAAPAPTSTSKEQRAATKQEEGTTNSASLLQPATTDVGLNDMSTQQQQDEDEDFVDPIASITSWWSSSGSKTVDSFWSSAKSNASQLREMAQQEANQLNEQLKKLPINEINEQLSKSINEGSSNISKLSNPKIGFNFLNTVYDSLVNEGEGETLKINLIYDLENFQNVDDLVYKNFRKVLRQVQGGVKLEINDKANSKRRKSISSNANGLKTRNLNLFQGSLTDGEKLVSANLENYINSYKVEENETSEASHLFLSILPIQIARESKASDESAKDDKEAKVLKVDNEDSSSFSFLIVLKDLTNMIEVKTRSQGLPIKWASWLDGSIEAPSSVSADETQDEDVDPTEWVKDWVDDALSLSFGVVSQTYVVERMGY